MMMTLPHISIWPSQFRIPIVSLVVNDSQAAAHAVESKPILGAVLFSEHRAKYEECRALQKGENRKIQQVQIGASWGPYVLAYKRRNAFSESSAVPVWNCRIKPDSIGGFKVNLERGHSPIGSGSASRMSLMHQRVYILKPKGTKTRADLSVAFTTIQTITECGFWRWFIILSRRNQTYSKSVILGVHSWLDINFLFISEYQVGQRSFANLTQNKITCLQSHGLMRILISLFRTRYINVFLTVTVATNFQGSGEDFAVSFLW